MRRGDAVAVFYPLRLLRQGGVDFRGARDRRVFRGLGFCVNVGADLREFRLKRGFPFFGLSLCSRRRICVPTWSGSLRL